MQWFQLLQQLHRYVALKLLIQDVYKASAPVSLAIVIGLFAAGITLSVIADRRDEVGPSAS